MNKYVLIGIPNTGKSTIGKLAAKTLQMPFYNTDRMVYDRMDPKCKEQLLLLSGIEQFMQELQTIMLELAKPGKPAIVEICPEGALMPAYAKIMKTIGTIIYIKRDTTTALAGVQKNREQPIVCLVNGKKIDMRTEVIKLYAKECHQYEALADITLNNSGSCDEAVNKLVAMIREHQSQTAKAPPS